MAKVTEVSFPEAEIPAAGSVLMFRFGARPAMLIHHQDGTFACFEAVCTHLGCTVQYQPEQGADLLCMPRRRVRPQDRRQCRWPAPKTVEAVHGGDWKWQSHRHSRLRPPCTAPSTNGSMNDSASRNCAHFAAHKIVPEHRHAFWYYWGGLSLFFFLVQVLTGILLLVYYRPGSRGLRLRPRDHL
jgi:hypothetical protein